MKFGTTVLLLSIVVSQTLCFMPTWLLIKKAKSVNHEEITEKAILQTAAETCRDVVRAEGKYFALRVRGTSAMPMPCYSLLEGVDIL